MNHITSLAAAKAALQSAWASVSRQFPLVLLTVLLVALALPAGMVVAPAFTGQGLHPQQPAPSVPPWQQSPHDLSLPKAAPLSNIASLSDSAPVPLPDALSARLNAALKPDGAGTFSGLVQDAVTGQVLFDRAGADARVPASNLKLLTATAALRSLGPDHRFSTKVLAGPTPGSVVLSAGGDVLLTAGESSDDAVLGHAGLATLARLTVKALQARGASGSVSVLLDDTLFTGSPLNPAWNPEDVAAGEVAPVFPIALNSARVDPATTTGPRPQDGAMTAAEAFAAQLSGAGAAAGLSVNPGVARVTPAAQGGQGTVLAEVTSATVQQQVDLMLQTSDNYLAEVMGRMSAIAAGGPGSNDGATANVVRQVSELGITTAGLRLADVSGLALADRVSARQLTQVVHAITSGTDPRLRAALDGFPVAGLTGTLSGRYADDSTAGGAGLVRAKTGTLNTVIALSGYVVDADGRLLVFSFIGNDLTPGAAGNTTALDRSASVLASCGCR